MSSVSPPIERTELANGGVQLSAGSCTFDYRRLKPGVLLISIVGNDRGQFGSAAVDEVASEFDRFKQPLVLFFDLRRASGPSTTVMELWIAWLAAHKDKLSRVLLLVPPDSKVLHLTVSIAQHLSHTGDLLRIYGNPNEFQRAIAAEVPGSTHFYAG